MIITSNETIQEEYDYLLVKRNTPTHITPVPEEVIAQWVGKLPNALLYTWQELGWCCFNNGLLWTVNPDDYKYVVDTWLEGTPYEQMDTFHVFARNAYGQCYVYAENIRRVISIMPQQNTIWADDNKLKRPQSNKIADIEIMLYLQSDNEYYDMFDNQEKPLFERALEKLGALQSNEIYAFEPFFMILPDNKVTIDSLIKVRMDVYTDMLYQFKPPTSRGTSYSDIFK